MDEILKCRLCLNNSRLKLMNGEIKQKIESLLSIRLCDNTTLSQHICSFCYDNVLNFEKFKEKVIHVQKTLNAYVGNVDKGNAKHETVPTVKRAKQKKVRLKSVSSNLITKIVKSLNTSNLERSSAPENNDKEPPTTSVKVESRDESELTSKSPVLPCEHCGGLFRFQEALDRHKKKRHPVFNCDLCSLKSINRMYFAQHKRLHLNLTTQKICSLCFAICDNSKDLYAHRAEKHSKVKHKPCTCNICYKNFRSILQLKHHKRKVHADGVSSSEPNGSKIVGSGAAGKAFGTQVIMNVHLKNSSPKSVNYNCARCSKKLSSRHSLQRHEVRCLSKADPAHTKSAEKIGSVRVKKGKEKRPVSSKNCSQVVGNRLLDACVILSDEDVECEVAPRTHKILDQKSKQNTVIEEAQVEQIPPNISIQRPTGIHPCNECGLVFYSEFFLGKHVDEKHGPKLNDAMPIRETKIANDSMIQAGKSECNPQKLRTDFEPNLKPVLTFPAMAERKDKFANTSKNFDSVPLETDPSERRPNFSSKYFPRYREPKSFRSHQYDDGRGRYTPHYNNKFSKFKNRKPGGSWNNFDYSADHRDRGFNKELKETEPAANKPSLSKSDYFVGNEISMSTSKKSSYSSQSSIPEVSIIMSPLKKNKRWCAVCSKVDCYFSCSTCRSCFQTQNLYIKHIKNEHS